MIPAGGVPGMARLAAVLASCAVALVAAGCSPGGVGAGSDDPTLAGAPPATALVVRTDLAVVEEYPARLGYGATVPLLAPGEGIVTALPEPGAVLARGDTVVEVDGRSARLLYGDRPAWRPLAVTRYASDTGPDVLQLNDNLAAMGYAPRAELPDTSFDWRTRQAVRDWQADLGVPSTGRLELGEVVFLPTDVRVAALDVPIGAPVGLGVPVARATGVVQVVTLDLPAGDRPAVAEGQALDVVLPDRTIVPASIAQVGRVARLDAEGANPTVELVIALQDDAGQLWEEAPVTVQVPRMLATDVLVVPVGALLAQPGGGYAVELVSGAARSIRVVRPGLFADGLVAVSGEVEEGDAVVVPG